MAEFVSKKKGSGVAVLRKAQFLVQKYNQSKAKLTDVLYDMRKKDKDIVIR